MIRRILVPLDRSRYTEATIDTACVLAEANRAEVEGIVVSPILATTEMEKLRDEMLASFGAICSSRNVVRRESKKNGLLAEEILLEARTFDLIVVGLRTHYHLTNSETEGEILNRLLSATSTPILAVPPGGAVPFERVIVAYDGSVPAARALREFAGIVHNLDDPEVTIVTSNSDPEEAEKLIADVTAYLKAYSFGRIKSATCQERLCEFVFENYLDSVDLVVAGIHSKSTVRDFFVGSFTSSLVEHGQTALLLSH